MDWTASARSNYFRVKDVEAFKAWCKKGGLEFIEREEERDGLAVALEETFAGKRQSHLVGFLCMDDGMPSEYLNRDTDDYEPWDWDAELADLLAEDSVAVVMSAGHEGLRYVSGWAFAVNWRHETKEVSLESIYDLAQELGNVETEASY